MRYTDDNTWKAAFGIMDAYIRGKGHLDLLLDDKKLGRSAYWLVMAAFRNWHIFDVSLGGLCQSKPKRKLECTMRLAVAEFIEKGSEYRSRIVNSAVEFGKKNGLSKGEIGFMNAVLRKQVDKIHGLNDDELLLMSCPAWLVDRWKACYGAERTRELLAWNRQIPDTTAWVQVDNRPLLESFEKVSELSERNLESRLEEGSAYIQDPFTAIPVAMLGNLSGKRVYDFCAAPGGKSHLLQKLLGPEGQLISVDKPGPRIDRLISNLTRMKAPDNWDIYAMDLTEMEATEQGRELMKVKADAVLLDVPCSNTGVIQKRPDVSIRLNREDLDSVVQLQRRILSQVCRCVKPGGTLVYSTCSLESEENENQVQVLTDSGGWELLDGKVSFPPELGHDGGGAFKLRRKAE